MMYNLPMDRALGAARQAWGAGCIPVGAAVVCAGEVIAVAYNEAEDQKILPLALQHAELLAMRHACVVLGYNRLDGCDLVVTLEPCAMCAAAAAQMRVRRLVFGAYDVRGGGVVHGAQVLRHTLWKPEVIGGVRERECAALLSSFFQQRR